MQTNHTRKFFYLKPVKANGIHKGKCLIMLSYFCQDRRRFKLSTRIYISKKHWSESAQRVIPSTPNATEINSSIEKFVSTITEIISALKSDGISTTPETIQERFKELTQERVQGRKDKLFLPFLDEALGTKENAGRIRRKLMPNSLKIYFVLRSHLVEAEKRNTIPLTFESFTPKFFINFVEQLSKTMGANATRKLCGLLKTLLRLAVIEERTEFRGFENARVDLKATEPVTVYLSEVEINAIYDLKNNPEILAREDSEMILREADRIVLGCWLGLRWSDLSRIEKKHIYKQGENWFLTIGTQKTEETVILPLHSTALDTLAQSETSKAVKSRRKPRIIVNGNGSDLSNTKQLLGRAKRKMITQKMALSLIDLAEAKGEPERKQAFWNTFYCQSKMYSANGRLYGRYCKNRFCTSCCANRKADILNKYLPILNTWKDPFFVTLTAKSVPARSLKKRMAQMIEGFGIIKERFKKRNQRGKTGKFFGIKSLECEFNAEKKTYNPHFHIIVDGEEMANALVKEWINLCTKNGHPDFRKFASRKGQFAERVYSNKSALIEIVKYGSKIFTEPDLKKKSTQKNSAQIYVRSLDNILSAMKGLRIFERFGFNLPRSEKIEKVNSQVLENYEEWKYETKEVNWVNAETEKVISDYLPTSEEIFILENNINKVLE